MSRSNLRAALALAAALCVRGRTCVGAVAGGQPEGSRAGDGRAAAADHAAAQQRAGVEGSPLGRAAGHDGPRARDERPDPARRARRGARCAFRSCSGAASCSRSPSAGSPSSTCGAATMARRARSRATASSSAFRRWTGTRTGSLAIVWVDARDHRAHPVARQVGAAAADRLHAVLLARDARQERSTTSSGRC